MSAATIASLVFFSCSLVGALAFELLLSSVGRSIALTRSAVVLVPSLLAMLYALIVYQNSERKIKRLGHSVSRGLLVMLLTWASVSAMISWGWCGLGACLSSTLLTSGIIGGGPMLLDALVAGSVTGVLIIRKPKARID